MCTYCRAKNLINNLSEQLIISYIPLSLSLSLSLYIYIYIERERERGIYDIHIISCSERLLIKLYNIYIYIYDWAAHHPHITKETIVNYQMDIFNFNMHGLKTIWLDLRFQDLQINHIISNQLLVVVNIIDYICLVSCALSWSLNILRHKACMCDIALGLAASDPDWFVWH